MGTRSRSHPAGRVTTIIGGTIIGITGTGIGVIESEPIGFMTMIS